MHDINCLNSCLSSGWFAMLMIVVFCPGEDCPSIFPGEVPKSAHESFLLRLVAWVPAPVPDLPPPTSHVLLPLPAIASLLVFLILVPFIACVVSVIILSFPGSRGVS